ncbi:hypothetical protein TrST_g9038 [Triparma strigata]|uniref:Histone deacetylase interacting domain-containing protein n=1 Tax=Triparma strigata TaxID=1606541 RepID=A0A9W6ZSW3_9STRA|nr:hypothetical protein TrST_g9038 [Triparma strigata]
MRELRVEDALQYLDQVKMEFGDRPHIYNEFLDIMKNFKSQQIDTPGVIRSVSNLFMGNKKLVLGFNTFLPEGYKIELPLDGNGPPVAVYQAPGQTGVTRILGPGSIGEEIKPSSLPPSLPAPVPAPAPAPAAALPAPSQQSGGQPVEFDHAINYVTTIKKRFANEPETYKAFLEILHTYQKEQRGIKEVLDEVSNLFADHPDLLKEFTYFLPDQVQEQAKKQLQELVAKKQKIRSQGGGTHTARVHPPPPQEYQQHTLGYNPGARSSGGFNPVLAFGATKPRSEDREREIIRSAVYGLISFNPAKPPKKVEMSAAQAAQTYGRPRAIPVPPEQPTVSEASYFDLVRVHLSQRDLQSTSKPSNPRHTPYSEFLKLLHLHAAALLTKEDLISMVKVLFWYGHGTRPAKDDFTEPKMKKIVDELMEGFVNVLAGRGPFAKQERLQEEKGKYGTASVKRTFEIALRSHAPGEAPAMTQEEAKKRETPSYRSYPPDYPKLTLKNFSDRTSNDDAILNNSYVSVPTCSMESKDFKERGNCHEALLFQLEDQRFEVDMAIDANAATLRILAPVEEEISILRKQEEADGQPIGRMTYKLKRRTFTTSHVAAIARVYGDDGDEILQHLKRNPAAVLPVVIKRLKQKDVEWRQVRTALNKKWKALHERVQAGALDFETVAVKRSLTSQHEDKALLTPWATGAVVKDSFKMDSDSLKLAYQLISSCARSDMFDTDLDTSRVWTEFMMPFFGLDAVTLLRETHAEYLPPVYPVGSKINTAFGVGVVEHYSNDKQFYKVSFPFGRAHLNPNSIFYPLFGTNPEEDIKIYGRSNHRLKPLALPKLVAKRRKVMEKTVEGDIKPTTVQKAMVTKHMFIFMRLFGQICYMLKGIMDEENAKNAPAKPAAGKKGPKKKGKKGFQKGNKARSIALQGRRGKKGAIAEEPSPEPEADPDAAPVKEEDEAPASTQDVEMSDAPSASSTPNDDSEPDQDVRKVSSHISNPSKYLGLVGLLKSRVRNNVDQTVYEACVRLMFSPSTIGNIAYLPDLIIRATDAMLHIIGADDEKEGCGNGFLRDIYISSRNYVIDDDNLLECVKEYSRGLPRHSNFMETVFEISYNWNTKDFVSHFRGDGGLLIEEEGGKNVKDDMEVEGEIEGGGKRIKAA